MHKLAVLFCFVSFLPIVGALGQVQNAPQTPTSSANATPKTVGGPSYAAESLVIEQLSTIFRYSADGTGSKEISAVARLQSDAAARQYGVLNIPFASSSERVELEYVRVLKPDGSTVETPAADAQEMPQEVTREAPFYSDLKEKQIPVRNLRIGDKLEYKVKVVRFKAETPEDFWGQEDFGAYAVILNETIELHLPKNKYVQVWSPEHKPEVSEAADEKIYRWTDSQLKPTILSVEDKRKASDEAAKKEINPEGNLPEIAWTTFKSWKDVGAWYRTLEGDRMVPDAAVKAKTAEIIAGKTTDDEKIRAIYAYVSTQIRYIGVALGIGRYQPHPAGEVLGNQYGDCKDKHTLLAAMLTAAGFHPEASLIGAGIRINPEVPAPSAFNHLITALPMNGTTTWLDSTLEVAPYGILMTGIRDKQTLVVPDTGAAVLERTPATLPFTPFESFNSTSTLATTGTVTSHMDSVSRGDGEILMRTIFRQVPPGQWEQLVQNLSQRLGFSGTTHNVEAGRPDNTTEPFKISYDYVKEKFGDWDNLRIVPMLPAIFVPIVDDKDPPTQPIDLGEPHIDSEKSVMTLPDGWGVTLPANVHKKTPYITFDKTYKIEGETLTVERKIEVLQRRIPISAWKIYKKWTDDTVAEGEPWIQLIKTGNSKSAAGDNESESLPEKGKQDRVSTLMSEAFAEIQRGEMNKAQATLDQVKSIDDKRIGLWGLYGYLRSLQFRWPEAAEALQKELALNPDNFSVYVQLANAQINAEQITEARESLRALMKHNPLDERYKRFSPPCLSGPDFGTSLSPLLKSR